MRYINVITIITITKESENRFLQFKSDLQLTSSSKVVVKLYLDTVSIRMHALLSSRVLN